MTYEAQPRICVVGSAMVDLVVRTPRFPVPGETLRGTSFQMGFGGKGSNQAIMAAKLGAEVSMVAKLGTDTFGEDTLANYKQSGISDTYIYFDNQTPSGVAPIWVDEKTGQNAIVIIPGANLTITPAEIIASQEAIQNSDLLICQLEISLDSTAKALELANKYNVLTILNPAPAVMVPAEIFKWVDICVPNETEASLLTGIDVSSQKSAFSAAEKLRSMGAGSVIVTLGDKGAIYISDDGAGTIKAESVRPVDSTGAGDAFIGTLAYQLSRKKSMSTAVRSACAVATMTVLKEGTQTSFPQRDEVCQLLD